MSLKEDTNLNSFKFFSLIENKFFLIGIVLLFIDQISKYFIFSNGSIIDLSFVKLDYFYTFNLGISFGLLSGFSWLIIVFTIVFFIFEYYNMNLLLKNPISFLLINVGAVGNLIDRIFIGAVRDMFHLTVFGNSWFIFNFADLFLTIGIIILIIDNLNS